VAGVSSARGKVGHGAVTVCTSGHLLPGQPAPVRAVEDIEVTLDELRYPARLNYASALLDEQVAVLGADRLCLISATQRWTYGELQRRANQVAQVLTENYGLLPGRRVRPRSTRAAWSSWTRCPIPRAASCSDTSCARPGCCNDRRARRPSERGHRAPRGVARHRCRWAPTPFRGDALGGGGRGGIARAAWALVAGAGRQSPTCCRADERHNHNIRWPRPERRAS